MAAAAEAASMVPAQGGFKKFLLVTNRNVTGWCMGGGIEIRALDICQANQNW